MRKKIDATITATEAFKYIADMIKNFEEVHNKNLKLWVELRNVMVIRQIFIVICLIAIFGLILFKK